MPDVALVLQVDLKDKWRNLERQGVVGPADSGPAALGAGAQQPQQQPDGSVMPPDGQQALDVQVHPALRVDVLSQSLSHCMHQAVPGRGL